MWMTVALVAGLSFLPGQGSSLALTNVRTTYGVLGPVRTDNKFLPGDSVTLAFTAEGVKADEGGKVLYSIAMEVSDDQGKVQFKQDHRDLEANNSLGGASLPAAATLQIGVDQPPGTYKVKVTVKDRTTGASGALTRSYEVLPRGFGLVRLVLSTDPDGTVTVPFAAEGQTLWVNFAAVGFVRDRAAGQPQLRVVLRVLDEEGRPTLAKPFQGEVSKDIPKDAPAVPMQFVLELNRAGKYTMELAGLDKVTGKKASLTLPLTVLPAKP